DETYYPHRFNCNNGDGTGSANIVCQQYLDGSGNLIPEAQKFVQNGDNSAAKRYYWIFMLQPYTKNYGIFACPSNPAPFTPVSGGDPQCTGQGCTGYAYGGQNSYGHNDIYLSPAQAFNGSTNVQTVSLAAVNRPAGTILLVDSTYYGAAPDVCNE